jgi:hypothetical protein
VTAAKNTSGLDWPTFLGRKFMENETQSYRDIFMAQRRLAIANSLSSLLMDSLRFMVLNTMKQ